MIAYERPKSAQDNFGKSIYQFQPNTKTLVKKLERILITLYRQNVSLLFNQTCLNEKGLPNYTHARACTHAHTHTHTHTHIYIYIYIYIYALSIMVTILGNEHDDMRSNPGQGSLHFTLRKYPWERDDSNYSSSFLWENSWADYAFWSWQLILEKGKL